jgi:ABC-type bacteriocin/lantibiotic exporter with double-glycine peptidase domain
MKKDRFNLRKSRNEITWIYNTVRSYIPSIVIIAIIGIGASLLGVSIAIISKNLIDAATVGDKPMIARYIVLLGAVIIVEIGLEAARTGLKIGRAHV